jgi:hypothetical protein
MSTLDDLKKQADEITQRTQTRTDPAGSPEEHWRKLAPVMRYLQGHFQELVNTLNVLDKKAVIDFRITDSVLLKGLKAKNFKITHPSADKEKEFVFEFENTGEHPCYANIQAGTPAAKFKDTLINNQISFVTTSLDKIKAVKFEIKPLVRTKYRFTANLEKELIILSISNYSDLWTKTNNFKKHDITSELIDELTRHVLREPNKYDELVGNAVSDEERTKIRENLKTRLNAQTAAGDAAIQPKQPEKKEKTLIGKLFRKA